MDQDISVEFSIGKRSVAHQFKLWSIESMSMCILVKEDSRVMSGIKVGDIFNMKYNSRNSENSSESECLKTAIRHIIKKDQGQFKGHYLVELEILENQG